MKVFKNPVEEWCNNSDIMVYLQNPYDRCPICWNEINASSMCKNSGGCPASSLEHCFVLHKDTEDDLPAGGSMKFIRHMIPIIPIIPVIPMPPHSDIMVYLQNPYDRCPICWDEINASSMCKNSGGCPASSLEHCFVLHKDTKDDLPAGGSMKFIRHMIPIIPIIPMPPTAI